MGSAPITQSLIDQVRRPPESADQINGYANDRSGPSGVRPGIPRAPQPELSTGYPHPEVELRLVRDGCEAGRRGGVLEMKRGAR